MAEKKTKIERSNSGRRGSRRTPQTMASKIGLGGGLMVGYEKRSREIPAWKGGTGLTIADPEQSQKNKELGYW